MFGLLEYNDQFYMMLGECFLDGETVAINEQLPNGDCTPTIKLVRQDDFVDFYVTEGFIEAYCKIVVES